MDRSGFEFPNHKQLLAISRSLSQAKGTRYYPTVNQLPGFATGPYIDNNYNEFKNIIN